MSVRDGLPCSLDGRGFLLDVEQFEFASIDPTRQGADTGAGASESSLSNQVVWRRVRDNWVGGAGQDYADLPDEEDPSLTIQFAESTNLEAFERRELTLHPPVTADFAGPCSITSGTVFQLAGGTLLGSKLMAGDATDPYTSILVAATAAWTSATASPGVILASGDTDTVARWRLRFQFSGAVPYLWLDINTTGAGTAYDVTLQSDTLAAEAIADGDVLIGAVQVWEDGADLKARFYLKEWGALTGTHPGNLMGGGGATYGGEKTAAGKSFPAWGAQTVLIGKGHNVSGAGYVGDNCRPWTIALAADDNFHSSTSAYPATLGDNALLGVAFFDGMCWRDSATVCDHTAQQITSTYIGTEDDCVITVVAGSVLPASLSDFSEPSVLPYNSEWSTYGAYVVSSWGVMRRNVIGTGDEVAFTGTPIWWILDPDVGNEIAGVATPFDIGFLVLVHVGGGFGQYDIWRHTGSSAGGAFASYLAGDFTGVWSVGGRVLCADDNVLYELTAVPGTTTIYTHPLTTFDWLGAMVAPGAVYAWGSNGAETQVYRLPVSDVTGAFDPPIPAGSLPHGERITGIVEHEGVLLIASYLGFRIALIDADGGLVFGGLLELGNCWAVCAFGRFAWLAASDTAGVRAFWKIDLSRFTDPDALLPAYESLPTWEGAAPAWSQSTLTPTAAAIIGTQQSVAAPFFMAVNQGYRFAGDWTGQASAEGTYDSGWFTFGIGETLALDSATIEADPTPDGSVHAITVYVDTPLEESVLVGSYNPAGEGLLTVRNSGVDVRAQRFKVRLVLTGDTATGTVPKVRRITLRAAPAPEIASEEMLLPLVLVDTVTSEADEDVELDVFEEFEHLLALRETRQPVTLQIGVWVKTVRVEGLIIRGGGLGGGNGLDGYDERERWLAGTWNVRVVTLD